MKPLRLFLLVNGLILGLAGICPAGNDIDHLNLNGRSLGMGASGLALDEYAASINSASLGREKDSAFYASQARLAYDRYGYQLLMVLPIAPPLLQGDAGGSPAGTLGIRFDQLITQNSAYYRLLYDLDGTPAIDPITNQQALQITYDTKIDTRFGLAYGLEIAPGWMLGGEGRAVHSQVGEAYAWGFDADLGVLLNLPGGLALGLGVFDLNGGWLAWHHPYQEETGRPEAAVGMSWRPVPTDLLLSGSLHQSLEWNRLPRGRIGAEYSGFSPLTLRAGWDADHLDLGAGFTWKMITVDYAAITSGALYDANRLTVRMGF